MYAENTDIASHFDVFLLLRHALCVQVYLVSSERYFPWCCSRTSSDGLEHLFQTR